MWSVAVENFRRVFRALMHLSDIYIEDFISCACAFEGDATSMSNEQQSVRTFHSANYIIAPTSEHLLPVYFQTQQQHMLIHNQASPLHFLQNEVDQRL